MAEVWSLEVLSLVLMNCVLQGGTTEYCKLGVCYWLATENPSSGIWGQGRTSCQSEGGDLAVIETETLRQFVETSLTSAGFSGIAWVGMTDADPPGQEAVFRWVNGAPLRYNGWSPTGGTGQPNGRETQNCGAIDGNGLYQDKTCDEEYQYLCSSVVPACTAAVDGCSEDHRGVTESAQASFSSLQAQATWYEANRTCAQNGQTLMTVRTDAKNTAITQDNSLALDQELWIGLSDLEVESMFRWETDGYLVTWVNWPSGEPSGGNQEADGTNDCVLRLPSGGWDVTNCGNQKQFYCETVTPICGLDSDNPAVVDGDASSCVTVPSRKKQDQVETLFTLKPKATCTNAQSSVTLTVTMATSDVKCDVLRGKLFTAKTGCSGNKRVACAVVLPASSAQDCDVTCDCQQGSCSVEFINGLLVNADTAFEICEIKMT